MSLLSTFSPHDILNSLDNILNYFFSNTPSVSTSNFSHQKSHHHHNSSHRQTSFCQEDFSLPCPKNFCLSKDGSCVAPYNWKGVCPIRNPGLNNLPDLAKKQWALTCNTPWACKEDQEAHRTSELACKNDDAAAKDPLEKSVEDDLKQLYPDPTDPSNPQNLTSPLYNPNAKDARFHPSGGKARMRKILRIARYGGKTPLPEENPDIPDGTLDYKEDTTLPKFGWGQALTPKTMAPLDTDLQVDPETGEPALEVDDFGIITPVEKHSPKPGLSLTGEGSEKKGPIKLEEPAQKGIGGLFKNVKDDAAEGGEDGKGPDISGGEGGGAEFVGMGEKKKVDSETKMALDVLSTAE